MFSAFFIRRPKFALVISIVLTLAGGLSIYMLPVTEYPSISPPNIQVRGVYPGASAEVVQATVGTPIEDAVNGVEDMIYMKSTNASSGSMQLQVSFEVGTHLDMANVLTQNRVSEAQALLPEPSAGPCSVAAATAARRAALPGLDLLREGGAENQVQQKSTKTSLQRHNFLA